LKRNRTELSLAGPLEDKIADKSEDLEDVIFAQGFPGIVDLQVPDGYLYIISDKNIFRIRPVDNQSL
jgi:aldose sugar dehydrogenase